MRKYFTYFLFAAAAVLAASCYYDNEEELYWSADGGLTGCDTANVKYSVQLTNTLQNYCLACHGPTAQSTGGGISLNSYVGLKNNISRVIGAINHAPGFQPMPKGSAKLTPCRIRQFEIWRDAGTPNN